MRIFIIGFEYFHYSKSVAHACEKLGHIVKLVELGAFEQHVSYLKKKLTKLNIIDYKSEYHEYVRRELMNEIISFQADICIILNGHLRKEILSEQVFQIMRSSKQKIYGWFLDSITRWEYPSRLLSLYDKIFCFEPRDIEYLENTYHIKAQYMPIGVADEIYTPVVREPKYDLCFVGNSFANRLPILEAVAQHCCENNRSFIIYGHYWDNHYWPWKRKRSIRKFKEKYPQVYQYATNEVLNPREVAQVYTESKICLNININIHEGTNPRTFEILSTKSFQLLDIYNNAAELLLDKEHLVFYKNIEDLLEKIDYYLENDKARHKIAEAGGVFVARNYTIKNCIEKMLCND